MRFINLLVVSIFLIIGITSCSGVKNDPIEISNAAIKCMKKGDFNGLGKFMQDAPKDVYQDLQDAYENPNDRNYKTADRAKDLVEAEYTLEEQKIDGDRAQIEYRVITPDIKTSVKFYFKKVDDKWFLEFIN